MTYMNGITFIIVTWNNEDQIEECIQTVMKYTLVPYHIIIVDNQSSDNTIDIIQSQFPTVELISSQDNLGFAKANNLALERVSSDYVCFLNPDTILTEDIVTPSLDILEKNSLIGLVSCKLHNYDGSWQPSCFHFADSISLPIEILHLGKLLPRFICKKYFPNFYYPKEDFCPDWVIGAEMIMRTKEAKEIRGFSTEYYMYTEDMDLCQKVTRILGKKIYYTAAHSLIHLGGASESQNINYNKQEKLLNNDILFIRKFYGDESARKTLKHMYIAYLIRLLLLKCFYYKRDRKLQIEKTQKVMSILKEISNDCYHR